MSILPQQQIDRIIQTVYNGDPQAFMADVAAYVHSLPQLPTKVAAASTAPVIIELQNVERTYKVSRNNSVTAVRGASMQIHEGEIVALTGPSGSGKSTLMHLIGGLDKPTKGTVTVAGKEIAKMSDGQLSQYRNRVIGFVFQFFYLQPFLKVGRNIEVPLMFAKARRNERKAQVDQAVQAVQLADHKSFFPKELSGGQMQRVAIARALVNKPKILLADEPTGNLDRKNSEGIMQLLQKTRATYGTTVVVVTHDPFVANWADRIIKIEDGQVVA